MLYIFKKNKWKRLFAILFKVSIVNEITKGIRFKVKVTLYSYHIYLKAYLYVVGLFVLFKERAK